MIIYNENCNEVDWSEAVEVVRRAPLGLRNPEKLMRAFLNGFASIFAYDDGKLVGMGRATCDGEYQAALYDIAVLPEYQKRGIGRGIVTELLSRLPVSNIILYAAPGKQAFYERLGFKPMRTAMAILGPRLADPNAGYL